MSANRFDKVLDFFKPGYAAEAAVKRAASRDVQAHYDTADSKRTDSEWLKQDQGPYGNPSLTQDRRRRLVKRATYLDRNNPLAKALLDRVADNVIGSGMRFEPMSGDDSFDERTKELWKAYTPDSRDLCSFGEWQWQFFRAAKMQGDTSGALLRFGQVQYIGSDYIQSPVTTTTGAVYDGVRTNAVGKPVSFTVAQSDGLRTEFKEVKARDMLFLTYAPSLAKHDIRGVPALQSVIPLLEQIDGTIDAVVMAYRISALFGAVVKSNNPTATHNALPLSGVSNKNNVEQKLLELRPGMAAYLGTDESIDQIKPEHPTTTFESFMTFLTRLSGIPLGLPIELALLDFSKTNYSSARASMEQAYRTFRRDQMKFAAMLSRLYDWRVSKWIAEGKYDSVPNTNVKKHRVLAQPWPYLNPKDDIQASMMAVDAGRSTLTDELAKQNMTFDDWAEVRSKEIQKTRDAGIPVAKSTATRDDTTTGVEDVQAE